MLIMGAILIVYDASARELITYSLKTDKAQAMPGENIKVELWASFDPGAGEPTIYKGQPAKVVSWGFGSLHVENSGREALWLPFQPAPSLSTTTGGSSTPFGLMGITVFQPTPAISDNPILIGYADCKALGSEPGEISFNVGLPAAAQSGMYVFVMPTLKFAVVEWEKISTAPIIVQIIPAPAALAPLGVAALIAARRRR